VPSPKFKLKPSDVGDGKLSILPDHPSEDVGCALLMDAMGTANAQLAEGLLLQLAAAGQRGDQVTQREINLAMATMRAIAPRDATEALLAAQMTAVHDATMRAARRLQQVETIDQQNSAGNMFNKLARTFAMQLEALKAHRSNGEQRVTVQHVNVSAQQAVVGITQGGGGNNESANQSHALGEATVASPSNASSATLLSHQQAVGMPLPSASRERKERLPNARR